MKTDFKQLVSQRAISQSVTPGPQHNDALYID